MQDLKKNNIKSDKDVVWKCDSAQQQRKCINKQINI